jgi:oxygen-independent coproporphyrinogen-3 oxidase
MEGIYLHIPFCRQACRYCDFYFTVSLHHQDAFTDRLLKEMKARKDFLSGDALGSFYLGGGTPSILSEKNLERIVETARELFTFTSDAEWTLEANPDDLGRDRLSSWSSLGFNRLSLGIQSFRKEELQLMRRSHTASQALAAVEVASACGFGNLSVDLIYGIPGQGEEHWALNLDRALGLPIAHLSAYHLSFEPGTVFEHWRKKGRITPVKEESSLAMYALLRKRSQEAGFEHYEISNFAREGKRSRHNQLYWSGRTYLGLGPSAHSYNGRFRSWNPASLKQYIEQVDRGSFGGEGEEPDLLEAYHDYLITALRTSAGGELSHIRMVFGDAFARDFEKKADRFVARKTMYREGRRFGIDPAQWIVADHILRELFMDEWPREK